MPLGGANFYGPKTGRGSETAYYYVESLTGGKYELHHSDTTPGTGYSVTDEDRYPITGFTFKTYTAEQGGNWFDGYYEKYDGARFYYTRNSYNIVFINGGAEDKTLSKKYQQDISDANYTPTAPAGKVGYELLVGTTTSCARVRLITSPAKPCPQTTSPFTPSGPSRCTRSNF